jgi:photosystem II stability/assembly factor-like uncharacterized protein
MRSRATKLGLVSVSLGAVMVLAGCDTGNFNFRFVVGEGGTIVATTDAGSTWSKQASGVKENLHGVAFSGTKEGCVAGGDGRILVTTDGSTWTPATTVPTTKSLYAIDILDTNSGPAQPVNGPNQASNFDAYAVGEKGTIIHSTDVCVTWAAQASGTTKALRGVSTCRCGSDDAWTVGDGGTIIATTDAGTTWTPQASGVKADLAAVSFVSSTKGWAVGQKGVILHTGDGGTTWVPQTSGTKHSLEGVAFADSMHGYAVGDDGVILFTSDGGTTWTKQSSHTSKDLDGVSTILNAAPFYTPTGDYKDAIAVGNSGVVLMTTDAGTTWTKVNAGTKKNLDGAA